MTQPNPLPVSVGENKDLVPPGSAQPPGHRTSSGLEKIARGLAGQEYDHMANDQVLDFPRQEYVDEHWADYWNLEYAIAALEALLEPTEEMIEAGKMERANIPGGATSGVVFRRIFTAMIRQALSSVDQTESEGSRAEPKLKITGELIGEEVREIKP
jgi:hypothetical protein